MPRRRLPRPEPDLRRPQGLGAARAGRPQRHCAGLPRPVVLQQHWASLLPGAGAARTSPGGASPLPTADTERQRRRRGDGFGRSGEGPVGGGGSNQEDPMRDSLAVSVSLPPVSRVVAGLEALSWSCRRSSGEYRIVECPLECDSYMPIWTVLSHFFPLCTLTPRLPNQCRFAQLRAARLAVPPEQDPRNCQDRFGGFSLAPATAWPGPA